jgi:hypothetical protein
VNTCRLRDPDADQDEDAAGDLAGAEGLRQSEERDDGRDDRSSIATITIRVAGGGGRAHHWMNGPVPEYDDGEQQ